MATLQPFPPSGRTCRRCYGTLTEILSDNAGRLFGCRMCRAVSLWDAEPPADVIERGTLSRRDRRRQARWGKRLRIGARRVPRSWERTRPFPDHWVVMPLAAFGCFGVEPKDIGDGWGFGLVRLERPESFAFHHRQPLHAYGPSVRMTAIETEVVTFEQVGGGSFGRADTRAPKALVLATFDRFTYERTQPAIRRFLQERR